MKKKEIIAELKKDIEELAATNSALQRNIEMLKAANKSLLEENEKLNPSNFNKLKSDFKAISTFNDRLERRIEELEKENRILTHTRDGLLTVTEDNKIDAERKDKEISQLKSTLDELKREISRLTKEKLNLMEAVYRQQNMYTKGYEDRFKEEDTENKQLNSRLSNQEESIKTLKGELALKEHEVEKLKAQLSDSQHIESVVIKLNNENYYTISRLTKETQALKAENEKLKAQIASAADYWKGEIKRMKTEVDKYCDKNKHLNALNDLLEKENKSLKEQMKDGFSAWCDGFASAYSIRNEPKVNKSFWRIFK